MRKIPAMKIKFRFLTTDFLKTYLVVPFTQKFQFLCLLVHEDPIKMSSLYAPDLDGLVAPTHDLPRPDVGHAGGQLPPLQHDVLGDLEVKFVSDKESVFRN